jgi:hypothetical protein
MQGLPTYPPALSVELARTHARPLFEAAIANARSGKFEDSEKAFLSAKAVYGGMSYYCNVEAFFAAEFAGWRAWVEKAHAQWEAEADARAAAWEAGALARAAAEVAQLKAEIARVEQEEAAREAAAKAEAARISAEKKAKKAARVLKYVGLGANSRNGDPAAKK